MIDQSSERRKRLLRRALPAGALAVAALAAGVVVGSSGSDREEAAERFGGLWERGDLAGMYRLITPAAAARYGRREFRAAYEEAAATATTTAVAVADPEGEEDGRVRLPVELRTRAFGRVRGDLLVPVEEGRVAWTPALVFPGLAAGERLTRRSVAPRRARLLASDGRTLAQGPAEARTSPLGEVAASIAGEVAEPDSAARRRALSARGFPLDQPVGVNGLERAFERQLAGRPGGALRAGSRVVARARPRRGAAVRTTIDPRLQEAAVTALAGRFGGIAALDARNGAIRALAGVAFSAPQPPGSTFKIVTTAAALEAGLVKPSTRFPVETQATIDGVPLQNAGGEACGGSFRNSFAHSCNSVFAPLGVRLGAARLVAAAQRFGFNRRPTIPGAQPSTLPPARKVGGPLDVGSTAIGQGRVLATPLVLASIAQAVAAGGVLSEPTLRAGERPRRRRVTSRAVARTLTRLMVDVVAYGTGTAAAIGGVTVAGKTGTAELEDTRGPNAAAAGNTNAWFAAFAPVRRPRVAVAVMFVRGGAGGATAAPAAKVVLEPAVARARRG